MRLGAGSWQRPRAVDVEGMGTLPVALSFASSGTVTDDCVCLRSSGCQNPHVRDHGVPSLGGGAVFLYLQYGAGVACEGLCGARRVG